MHGAASRVEAIRVAEAAGAPMHPLEEVAAVAGVGLAGDRYATRCGHRSPMRHSGDVLTLVEGEVVDAVVARHGIGPADTRRNIVTRGVRLDELIGREIGVGLSAAASSAAASRAPTSTAVRVGILPNGRIVVGDPVGPD